MSRRLYFAHAVNAYNTPIEGAAINLIATSFPGSVIENPNQPHHQVGYKAWQQRTAKDRDTHKGMSYFYDDVLPTCDGCVAMSFLDGRMGLGVAGEAKWFLERWLPVYVMLPLSKPTPEQVEEFIKDPASGLFAIRSLTDIQKQQLLLADTPPLVLSHQETRLRTWTVYNKKLRPYEKAHEASMSVPVGFYPE
jgi:hypothetical protein